MRNMWDGRPEIKVAREFHFSMGHTLSDYDGKCANLHGHNYRLIVTLGGEVDDSRGMFVDFGEFKNMIDGVLADYDHHFLIFVGDPRAIPLMEIDKEVRTTTGNPTCEFLVNQLFWQIHEAIQDFSCTVQGVQLWETENCYAEI